MCVQMCIQMHVQMCIQMRVQMCIQMRVHGGQNNIQYCSSATGTLSSGESLLSLMAALQTPWAHLSASPPLELQANATMTRSFRCFVCLFEIMGSENQAQVPVLDSHILQILHQGLFLDSALMKHTTSAASSLSV